MSTSILILAAAAMLSAQPNTNLTWNGSLIDETCRATSAAAKCEVNDQTRMFGVRTGDGKYFKLDIDGNNKAREALTSQKKSGTVQVAVSGLLDGETIKVAALQIR